MSSDLIKIKIFSDFATPDGNQRRVLSWGKGIKYRNIEFVGDTNDYTHMIFLNVPNEEINVPPENVLVFLWEPYELLDMNKLHTIKHKIGCLVVHNTVDWWRNGGKVKPYISFIGPGTLDSLSPQKTHKMSILASSKASLPGHQLRHGVIKRILDSTLNIDIFGEGIQKIFTSSDPRIKGTISDAYDAMLDYKYTIVIENSKYDYYVTEKYFNAIVCASVPIYWGARAITSIFGNAPHIELPETTDADIVFAAIEDIYHKEPKRDTFVALSRLKEDINFPHFVWQHFSYYFGGLLF